MKLLAKQLSVLILLSVATIAYSFQNNIEEFHMLGLNLSLQNKNVSGNAKRLKFENIDEVNATIKGQVDDENLKLSINNSSYIFEGLGSFVKETEAANLSEFEFENGQKSMRVEASSIKVDGKDDTNITGLKGNCYVDVSNYSEFKNFIINTCTSNATLNITEFKQKNSKLIKNVFNMKANEETRLSNFNLQISNHNLRLQVKVHAQLKVTAKIEGQIKYLGNSNTLSIRIDKAKASFLNIKKKIFEEVEKMDNPNLKVERPYIYYKLD